MATRWPIEERGLDELDLDLQNVRIPSTDLDESAIASYLVEAEDLLDLVRDILRDDYIDNELPVVVVERGRHVVLEGNRRITALKAIHDPALLGKSSPKVERLLSRYSDADISNQVRVMIAPSRDAAQPLLARLHTRNPKKSWIREQQAIFYHAQLSPTVTTDVLRARYPAEKLITSFIRMGEMRELIRGMRFRDPDLAEFIMANQLKMTSFEYAYDLPRVQQLLGLSFGKDGLLASKQLTDGQRRGLEHLLRRFQAKTLNTRSLELRVSGTKADQFIVELQRWVDGEVDEASEIEDSSDPESAAADSGADEEEAVQPGAPADTGTGSNAGAKAPTASSTGQQQSPGANTSTTSGNQAASTGNSNGTAAGAAAAQTNTRGPNRVETRSRLDMDGFEYKGTSAGLRRRFEELKRLDVRDFPNAAYDLMRTVLECSIKDHFVTVRGTRLVGKMIGPCMTELIAAYNGDNRMTSLINSVNRKGSMSAGQYTGTTGSLNASNHEPDTFASSKDVHEAWDRLKPILIEIVGK
ncbi:hypothetical protein GCM10009827_078660 [Dactylosporangium maewongense]|uniref:ParB/Sulfiredoxin domain-containing protein n=2 Tax=Dactylosporangium maewongense TaxID=634393 RepID=A0ABP4MLD6_9ACTN